MMFFFLTIIFKREKEMERDGELLGRLLSFPFSFFWKQYVTWQTPNLPLSHDGP